MVLAFAFLAIACGGGDSGSGGDAGDEEVATRGLLVRWHPVADIDGYVIHWGVASGAYTHALDVGEPEPSDDGVVSFLLEDVAVAGTIFLRSPRTMKQGG